MHLIYIDVDGIIKDTVYDTADEKWTAGTLRDLEVKIPKGSNIAATSWGEGKSENVRVFFQNEDDQICVISYPVNREKLWYLEPHPLSQAARPGTWLAAGHRITGHLKHNVPYVYFSVETKSANNKKPTYQAYVLHEDGDYGNRWYGQDLPRVDLKSEDKICSVNNYPSFNLGEGQFHLKIEDRGHNKDLVIRPLGQASGKTPVYRYQGDMFAGISSIAAVIHNDQAYIAYICSGPHGPSERNKLRLGITRSNSLPKPGGEWSFGESIYPVDEHNKTPIL